VELLAVTYAFQTRHQIGDVQVLDKQGQPVILFQQIANPQNIKNHNLRFVLLVTSGY
jgi:hypothetical protein